FVELYNNTPQPVSVAGWHLEYKSATGASYSASNDFVIGSGTVPAHGWFLIAGGLYDGGFETQPDWVWFNGDAGTFSGSLSGGGNIRIGDPGLLPDAGFTDTTHVIDTVAYGTGNAGET